MKPRLAPIASKTSIFLTTEPGVVALSADAKVVLVRVPPISYHLAAEVLYCKVTHVSAAGAAVVLGTMLPLVPSAKGCLARMWIRPWWKRFRSERAAPGPKAPCMTMSVMVGEPDWLNS